MMTGDIATGMPTEMVALRMPDMVGLAGDEARVGSHGESKDCAKMTQ